MQANTTGTAGRSFLKPSFSKTVFTKFPGKILSSFYVIPLAWKISYCLAANHNVRALVVHVNCTALSQSELSHFFMYIIMSRVKLRENKMFLCCLFTPLCCFFMYLPKQRIEQNVNCGSWNQKLTPAYLYLHSLKPPSLPWKFSGLLCINLP